MVTNGVMTHYHSSYDDDTRLLVWTRYNYSYVMFQGGKGSSLNRGYEKANDVKVRIPYDKNTVSIDNFSIGDIIVNEALDIDITSQEDLEDYDVFNVTSIRNNDYTEIEDMKHIHIEGK